MAAGKRIDLRQPNLYDVLQISAHASQEVVHAAYRVLARAYHPDVNDSPEAAERMRQVNAAYAVLSKPRQRAAYDARRARRPAMAQIRTRQATGRATSELSGQHKLATTRDAQDALHGGSTGSSLGHILLAVIVIAFVASLTALAAWLISEALDDSPSRHATLAWTVLVDTMAPR
jgi:curved DNA-binding protein CbpA